MMLRFTVLAFGRRIERTFAPDEAVAAAVALNGMKADLACGFVLLLQGEDNVIHIAHREPPR